MQLRKHGQARFEFRMHAGIARATSGETPAFCIRLHFRHRHDGLLLLQWRWPRRRWQGLMGVGRWLLGARRGALCRRLLYVMMLWRGYRYCGRHPCRRSRSCTMAMLHRWRRASRGTRASLCQHRNLESARITANALGPDEYAPASLRHASISGERKSSWLSICPSDQGAGCGRSLTVGRAKARSSRGQPSNPKIN